MNGFKPQRNNIYKIQLEERDFITTVFLSGEEFAYQLKHSKDYGMTIGLGKIIMRECKQLTLTAIHKIAEIMNSQDELKMEKMDHLFTTLNEPTIPIAHVCHN